MAIAGEDGDRRGRVAADAGEDSRARGWTDFMAIAGDDRGGLVEAEGAAGIAQAAPPPTARLRGRRPARTETATWPARPGGGQDAAHRGLLQHDLADQHRPRARARCPPRQVAGVRRIPGENRLGVRRRQGEAIIPGGGTGTARIADCILFACDGTNRRSGLPMDPSAYWRRRFFILGGGLAVLAVLAWQFTARLSAARLLAVGSSMAALRAERRSRRRRTAARRPRPRSPPQPTRRPPLRRLPQARSSPAPPECDGQRPPGPPDRAARRATSLTPGHEPGQLRADGAA